MKDSRGAPRGAFCDPQLRKVNVSATCWGAGGSGVGEEAEVQWTLRLNEAGPSVLPLPGFLQPSAAEAWRQAERMQEGVKYPHEDLPALSVCGLSGLRGRGLGRCSQPCRGLSKGTAWQPSPGQSL